MYIMSSVVIEQEPNFAQVLASNNQLNTAETETFYYVTNNVNSYLNTEEKPKPSGSQENFSTLKSILARRDGKTGRLFHNSQYSAYNNVQSVAHLNPESNSCNNLVLEVRYEIFWAQTEIVKVGLWEMLQKAIMFVWRYELIFCLAMYLLMVLNIKKDISTSNSTFRQEAEILATMKLSQKAHSLALTFNTAVKCSIIEKP